MLLLLLLLLLMLLLLLLRCQGRERTSLNQETQESTARTGKSSLRKLDGRRRIGPRGRWLGGLKQGAYGQWMAEERSQLMHRVREELEAFTIGEWLGRRLRRNACSRRRDQSAKHFVPASERG